MTGPQTPHSRTSFLPPSLISLRAHEKKKATPLFLPVACYTTAIVDWTFVFLGLVVVVTLPATIIYFYLLLFVGIHCYFLPFVVPSGCRPMSVHSTMCACIFSPSGILTTTFPFLILYNYSPPYSFSSCFSPSWTVGWFINDFGWWHDPTSLYHSKNKRQHDLGFPLPLTFFHFFSFFPLFALPLWFALYLFAFAHTLFPTHIFFAPLPFLPFYTALGWTLISQSST